MDRKGQGVILGLMFFAMALILAIIFVDPLSELISEQRTDLECSADGKSPGVYMTCIVLDVIVAFFIGVIIVGGASLIFPGRGG